MQKRDWQLRRCGSQHHQPCARCPCCRCVPSSLGCQPFASIMVWAPIDTIQSPDPRVRDPVRVRAARPIDRPEWVCCVTAVVIHHITSHHIISTRCMLLVAGSSSVLKADCSVHLGLLHASLGNQTQADIVLDTACNHVQARFCQNFCS